MTGKKITKIIILNLVFFLCVVIMSACLPYSGKLSVAAKDKDMFDMQNFYGDSHGSERVMLLSDPKESFFHRIGIIEQAEREINFTTHATYNGYSTYTFFEALLRAADRGVKVNITIDGKFGNIQKDLKYALIAHNNINYIDYNPFNFFKIQFVNVALHEKILTVDNKYMIVGGRNIGSRFFAPDDYKGVLSLDREILVYNPSNEETGVIKEVRAHFKKLGQSDLSKARTKVSRRQIRLGNKKRAEISGVYDEYITNKDFESAYDTLTMPVNKVSILTNPVTGGKKAPTVAYNLFMMAKKSERVVIQTPYTVLTNKNLKYLKEAQSGRDIKLVTNTLANTPNLPAFSNYYVNRKKILKTGVNIYEYQGAHNVHAKSYMFDDRLSVVGSFNLDERSVRIDTEIMLVVDSEEFQDVLRADIDNYFAQSLQVGANNKFIPNENVKPNKVSGAKKFFYPIAGFFLNLIKYLI